MDKEIRRLENNLITLGTGVIAFGVWTFLKFVIYLIFGNELDDQVTGIAKVVTIIILLILGALDMLLRLYIGASARSQGRGKKKSGFYIVITALMILVLTLTIGIEVYSTLRLEGGLIDDVITLIIDVTSLVILVDLMVSAVRLRKLKKYNIAKKEASA